MDCAYVYENEKEVGEGIAAKIKDGTVKREELFVVSKLWNTFHRPDLVEPMLKKQLQLLGLEYLDIYLIHWPVAYKVSTNYKPHNLYPLGSENYIIYASKWSTQFFISKTRTDLKASDLESLC